MKKVILIVTVILLIVTGCTYQAENRPKPDENQIWVCKEPYCEMYWLNGSCGGKLIVNDVEYCVKYSADYGNGFRIYEKYDDSDIFYTDEYEKYCLIRGKVQSYDNGRFTMKVKYDYKNLFDGEKPTMTFVRYSKRRYLNSRSDSRL